MAMSNPAIPSYLLDCLRSPNTPFDVAVDALEEWISGRRAKGATLFEVSVGLAELEAKTPPFVVRAFDRARYVTNVPQPSDLTPPTGPFPLASSQSVQSILHHLLSKPIPSIQHSREVILEFVLAREGKLREKKSGRGGKGTLGRESFEEISKRLGEIEDGLKGIPTISPRRGTFSRYDQEPNGESYPSPQSPPVDLDEARTIGLMLILSLRLSLSYFTLQGLAEQLLLLSTPDAERTLVQHIRRRVQGEGRFGVGKELEFLESSTVPQRPALRPVFRSAKVRTHLPSILRYPIALPAPSKSTCIKQLLAFAKDVENGVVSPTFSVATQSSFSSPSTGQRSDYRRAANSPASLSKTNGSPRTPMSANPLTLPPLDRSPPKVTLDPEPLKSYALELVSEYLTREKREYMIKQKWAKSGRDQLGKDLGDIESSLCLSSKSPTPLAPTLLPTFLLLRRTFALPPSPLPASITEPYFDILPAPPDSDEEPFREPTVSSTTVALYQNPRLADDAAMEALEELMAGEKEKVDAAGATEPQQIDWCLKQIESVKKRFPDGSYEAVFAAMSQRILNPTAPLTSMPEFLGVAPGDRTSHRRTQSGVPFPMSAQASKPPSAFPQNLAPNDRATHTRSISMPMRKGTYDDMLESESSGDPSPPSDGLPPLLPDKSPLPSPQPAPPSPPQQNNSPTKRQPPERIITTSNHIHSMLNAGHMVATPNTDTPASSGPTSSSVTSPLSLDAGANLLSPVSERSAESRQTSVENRHNSGGGGWWDVVSAVEPSKIAPWHDNPRSTAVRRMSVSSSDAGPGPPSELPLPPGAEPATVQDMSASFANMLELDHMPVLSPPAPPMRAHNSSQSVGSIRLVSASSPSSAPIAIGAYAQPSQPFAVDSAPSASPTRSRLPFASSPSRSSPRSGVSPGRFGGFFRPSHSRNSSATRAVQSTEDLGSEPSPGIDPPGLIDFSRPAGSYEPSTSSIDSGDLPVPTQQGQAYSPSSLGQDTQDYVGAPEIMSGTMDRGTPIWAQYNTSPPTTPTLPPPTSNNVTPTANGATSSNGITPAGSTGPGIGHPSGRPKLFARSVTLTLGTKSKGREKGEKDKNKENEKTGARASMPGPGRRDRDKEKEKVSNKPKNWNRDMVADIMGPPADRR